VLVANRAAAALPSRAWNPAWSPTLAEAVARRIDEEDADPERFAPSHRFDDAAAPDEVNPADAPHSFVLAVEQLRAALAAGDPARIPEPLAQLALAACDLADPFQMTPLDRDELPGARARFVDLIDPSQLAATPELGAGATPASWTDGGLAAAVELARNSAAARESIEPLAVQADPARMQEAQRGQLARAAALARLGTELAWREASAIGIPTDPACRVWPNPVVDQAALSFIAPATGPARLELYDLAGRRIASSELDRMAAGPHVVDLDHAQLAALRKGIYFARLSSAGHSATARFTYSPR